MPAATASEPTRPARRGLSATRSDADLVAQVQAGDQGAYEAIFRRYQQPLLSYCRHMLGGREEAEDALQQAFIRVHRALAGGSPPRELRPWLYAIARNCCLTAAAARRPTALLDGDEPGLDGLAEEVARREALRELVADLGRLPEEQRSALLLAELEDLSHAEIGEIVGCPVTKVKALVYQARTALLADRSAREADCRDIREELAVARGGELRRGPLRRHLQLCAGCRDFQVAVGDQRRSLAIVLPVAASAGFGAKVLGHASALHGGLAGGAVFGGPAAGVGAAAGPAAGLGGVTGTTGTLATTGLPLASVSAVAGPSGLAGASASASTLAAAGTGAATGGAAATAGSVVGSGLLAKLAIGGAVASLATAGAVAVVHHRHGPAGYMAGARPARLIGVKRRDRLGARASATSGSARVRTAHLGSGQAPGQLAVARRIKLTGGSATVSGVGRRKATGTRPPAAGGRATRRGRRPAASSGPGLIGHRSVGPAPRTRHRARAVGGPVQRSGTAGSAGSRTRRPPAGPVAPNASRPVGSGRTRQSPARGSSRALKARTIGATRAKRRRTARRHRP